MKVVFLMPSFRGGGAERVFIDLAHSLHEQGKNVELIVLSAEGNYKSQINPSLNLTILEKNSVSSAFFDLLCIFRKYKNTIFVSCLTHLNAISGIAWMISGSKNHLIATEHNHFSSEKSELKGLKKWFHNWLIRNVYRHLSIVVSVSEGVKDDLCKSLGIERSKIKVIYNPIHIERVIKLSQDEIIADETFFDGKSFYIFSMGRLVRQKRFDLLLMAFQRVLPKLEMAKLVIIGDGPLKAELYSKAIKLGIAENVLFLPFQGNPFQYIKKADVFVLTSDFEGFGNVLVEALALGKQIVSTDAPSGPREILDDGKFGALVNCSDVDAIAEKILAIANETLIFNDQLTRANEFDVYLAAKQYWTLFEEIRNESTARYN